MTELKLDDRRLEDSEGTWTRLRFDYGSPWSNGDRPDVTMWIDTFKRKPDKGFDFGNPDSSKLVILDEVNIGILAGYLDAVNKLMWRQWRQKERLEVAEAKQEVHKERERL